MKKSGYFLFLIAFVILLLGTGFNLNAEIIQLDGDEGNSLVMKENSITNLHLINSVNELGYFVVKTDQGYFTNLKIEGFSKVEEVGSPMLPVMRKLIEIPSGATPEIEVVSYEVKEYSLFDLGIEYPVMPAQFPYIKSNDSPPPFEYNSQIYNHDAFWKEEMVDVEVLGYMRGVRIARIDISPFEYNPVTHTIKVYQNIDVKIKFQNANPAETNELKSRFASPYFESAYGRLMNYKPLKTRDTITKYPVKFVIVSDPMFQEQLQPLVEWKTKKGFTVIEGYTDDPQVGTTTASIKAYVQGLYEAGTAEDPAPSFVLFVGDIGEIPAWNLSGPSDLKYCEFTNDYFPEIYYGRFSAQSTAQLQPQIDKTLQYEQFTMPDPSYLEEAVLVAGMDSGFGNDWANGTINYGTENYFNAAHGFTSHVYLYPESGGQATSIRQHVSDGVGIGNYTAHCSSAGWADPSFTTSHVSSLQNQDKYGVLIGNCCCSNEFDVNACFGEALLRAENKGAVAYIGGSNNTMWDEDYYWAVGVGPISEDPPAYEETTLGVYDGAFHDHGEPESDWYTTVDQMIFIGNLAVTEGTPGSAQYYWDIYCVMGDPSLTAYLAMPSEITVSYDALMPLASSSFTVAAEPYAYVAISKDGVLHGAAYADETGNADVALNPITVPGNADVVVTCQNRQPFISTVLVASPEGPYVLLNSFGIDDNSGNNNGQPDFSEDVLVNLMLENVGNSDATNLTATLTSSDENITITNGSHICNDIVSQEFSEENGAFAISVHELIPDMHDVGFDLSISDGNETWNSTLSMKIHAPSLAVGSMLVDDTELGNGNGRIDPGEMLDLYFQTLNNGSCDALKTIVYLSTVSEYITLTSNEFEFDHLPSDGSADAMFSIIVDPAAPIGSLAELLVSVDSDPYLAEKTFTPKIGLVVEDFESGTFMDFDWAFAGNSEWTVTETDPYSGMYCAKSGTIGDNQSTVLEIELEVTADDSIAFYRKVSSEDGYDYLKFYIDNAMQGQWAGNKGWERIAYPVTAGMHTFKWEYNKDVYVSTGDDCAWIDYIIFPSMDASGGDLSIHTTASAGEICSSSEAYLFAIPSGGTGEYTYSWSPVESLSDPTVFNPIASPDETTIYTVEVYDGETTLTADISLDVLVSPEPPEITQSGIELVSNIEEGNQWYYWGAPLEGATSQTYMPTASGNYYATVTGGEWGCESDPSNVINYLYTGIADPEEDAAFRIYPNPVNDIMNIYYSSEEGSNIKISLLDAVGKEISLIKEQNQGMNGEQMIVVNTTDMPSGVYYCKFETSEATTIKKIIISK